jgi:ERCC4-type nuclease
LSKDVDPVIAIDTREQAPYDFDGSGLQTVRIGLSTADYSVVGLEAKVAIERKMLQDFVSCCTHERPRFWRELERLKLYPIKAVVVEGTIDQILMGQFRGAANPRSIVASALAIVIDHQIPVLFSGSRQQGERCTLWMLRRAWARRVELGLVPAPESSAEEATGAA